MIRITSGEKPIPPGDLHILERVLRKRLRSYDQAGLLENNVIVVLLPETNRDGGLKVADDLQLLLGDDADRYRWQIVQYPPSDTGSDDSSDGMPIDRGGFSTSEKSKLADGQRAGNGAARPANPVEIMLSRSMPRWKRGMDIALSAAGLACTAPIIGLAALAIKLTSPGPVLFQQRRSGVGGKPFLMHKLRTMSVDAEAQQKALRHLNEQDGPAFKIENDPRVFPVGLVLRTTCIDELPQLWNVLRGEMSIVGPRPLPCHESDACRGWRRARLDITPGLTCIWQVKGRSKVSFDEWMRMDLEYANRQTLVVDLMLILGTVGLVAKSVRKINPWRAASPAI